MSDIIQLLPDSVANQIAAGEVIQRPASAVKELMENAIDSGADCIKLIIKDGGKSLIQVIDNGCGMSETDARLSFERHATSKIRTANDLFAIKTKGFRGEALASIAAIAHVTLKTKKVEDELGTQIVIEGSNVVSQEPCGTNNGSSFSIKNLFYNVPARRNFLKRDSVELKHIYDEFQRVAFAHPAINFELHNNGNQIYKLDAGNFRQRVVAIMGKKFNQRLVPISEQTDIVTIEGYIGKPEFALKKRGEQFLFVNNRFIRSNYLNHAIQNAFQNLVGKDQHPSYFLLLEVPTDKIDVNIHPTKTEVKFIEEKAIYAILRSATKKALGEHNIAPTIDFSLEQSFDISVKPTNPIYEPTIKVNPDYNPFDTEKREPKTSTYTKPISANKDLTDSNNENWESLYAGISDVSFRDEEDGQQLISDDWKTAEVETETRVSYQLHNKYIVMEAKSGILIIDQQKAHERILYERFLKSLVNNKEISQQQLFPITLEFSPSDFSILKDLENEIRTLGFDIREFGKNTYAINGTPSDIAIINVKEVLEGLIEEFVKNTNELKLDKRESLARSLAYKTALKSGKKLSDLEIKSLLKQLFACESPYAAPNGKSTIISFTLEDLLKQFNK